MTEVRTIRDGDPIRNDILQVQRHIAAAEHAAALALLDRGEQPDSAALPDAGAQRGDVPLSETERSEV